MLRLVRQVLHLLGTVQFDTHTLGSGCGSDCLDASQVMSSISAGYDMMICPLTRLDLTLRSRGTYAHQDCIPHLIGATALLLIERCRMQLNGQGSIAHRFSEHCGHCWKSVQPYLLGLGSYVSLTCL